MDNLNLYAKPSVTKKKNCQMIFIILIKKKSLSKIITKYLKIHIREQVKSGATIIQIFDSWAGLAVKDDIKTIIYNCSADLVEFTKSLGVPAICFPREIVNY